MEFGVWGVRQGFRFGIRGQGLMMWAESPEHELGRNVERFRGGLVF